MNILGVESSCDDTAVALVNEKFQVTYSTVLSQTKIHEEFGGVVPEIAARSHLDNIEILSKDLPKFDAIAVTRGPGLIGSLLVGASFAKGLAAATKKPLIPINHVHAHIYSVFLDQDITPDSEFYPALTLVVSGGHTHLYHQKSKADLKLISHSIDDACGECFDKIAKKLGLSYPGGPQIEKLAQSGDPQAVEMPKVMLHDPNFSYSGLKTHVVNLLRKKDAPSHANICASFQKAAFEQVIRKLKNALTSISGIKRIVIAGGVSANENLRSLLIQEIDLPVHAPKLKYCSDNGAMIAAHAQCLIPEGGIVTNDHHWDVYSQYPWSD